MASTATDIVLCRRCCSTVPATDTGRDNLPSPHARSFVSCTRTFRGDDSAKLLFFITAYVFQVLNKLYKGTEINLRIKHYRICRLLQYAQKFSQK